LIILTSQIMIGISTTTTEPSPYANLMRIRRNGIVCGTIYANQFPSIFWL